MHSSLALQSGVGLWAKIGVSADLPSLLEVSESMFSCLLWFPGDSYISWLTAPSVERPLVFTYSLLTEYFVFHFWSSVCGG